MAYPLADQDAAGGLPLDARAIPIEPLSAAALEIEERLP